MILKILNTVLQQLFPQFVLESTDRGRSVLAQGSYGNPPRVDQRESQRPLQTASAQVLRPYLGARYLRLPFVY